MKAPILILPLHGHVYNKIIQMLFCPIVALRNAHRAIFFFPCQTGSQWEGTNVNCVYWKIGPYCHLVDKELILLFLVFKNNGPDSSIQNLTNLLAVFFFPQLSSYHNLFSIIISEVYYYHMLELKTNLRTLHQIKEIWILCTEKDLFTLELLELFKYANILNLLINLLFRNILR